MELSTLSAFLMDNSTDIDTLTSYINGSQAFTENSIKEDSVTNPAKVDYIGYVTTPLLFFVGVVGKIY